jgi:pimeloyl-ACP methyl ester carboxylesterase
MTHRARRMSWRHGAVAVLAAAGCLLAGQPASAATPASAKPAAPPVTWGTCAADVLQQIPPADREKYSCAVYNVPLDYARPSAGAIGLAMLRRAADDQAHKIGSLFLNPGGPGGPGYTMPIPIASLLPAEVAQRFDVIGFDPRGVGRSAPLRCFTTEEAADAVFSRIVDVPVTRPEIESTLRANRDYTDACAANAGPLLPHMSTLDVARDLDRMRQGVGDKRLNYLGFSYGTLLGATYANLYPDRVRAVILDGNVDPKLRTADGLEYLRQRAIGQEDVVNAFLQRCADVGPKCAFSSGDPAAKFVEIRNRLRQGPVNVPALGGEVTLSQFTGAVSGYLYSPDLYAELATALQLIYEAIHPAASPAPQARARTGVRPLSAIGSIGLRDERVFDTPYTSDDSFLAVNCADEPFPRVPALYPVVANLWEHQAPTVGRQHAFSQVGCATWPAKHPEAYRGPWNRKTATTVLLFGNYHDPATNYRFNKAMAAELGNARLVSDDAFGHTILGGASVCADTIATRYLVDLKLPARGTVCQPDKQPFE